MSVGSLGSVGSVGSEEKLVREGMGSLRSVWSTARGNLGSEWSLWIEENVRSLGSPYENWRLRSVDSVGAWGAGWAWEGGEPEKHWDQGEHGKFRQRVKPVDRESVGSLESPSYRASSTCLDKKLFYFIFFSSFFWQVFRVKSTFLILLKIEITHLDSFLCFFSWR